MSNFINERYETNRKEIIKRVSQLPIQAELQNIIESAKNYPVSIIEAETWSWKTTQISKICFLNNEEFVKRTHITQPRVLAALLNSERVAIECNYFEKTEKYSLWKLVGYRTGNFDKTSTLTRLLFTTDAQELLRWLINNIHPDYLILDEVHMFSVYTEILLALIKQYIAENYPKLDTHFILMSATLDKNLLINYFKDVLSENQIKYFYVPGRTYNITEHYLPGNKLIETIVRNTKLDSEEQVLVFLPTKKSIYKTITQLKRIFWKNIKEAKISKISIKLNSYFSESLDTLKQHLWDNQIEEVIDIEKLKKFQNLLQTIIKNKVKNISYMFNESQIYVELYEIFCNHNHKNKKLQEIKLDIYSKWVQLLNEIFQEINSIDHLLEDFHKTLSKLYKKLEAYTNIPFQAILKSNLNNHIKNILINKINKINFSDVEGFSFMIKTFLQRSIDRWVNDSLLERNISIALDKFHPCKVYQRFEKEIKIAFNEAINYLISQTKKHTNILFAENWERIIINHIFSASDSLQKIQNPTEKIKIEAIRKTYHNELNNIVETKKAILEKVWKNIYQDNLFEIFEKELSQVIEEINKLLSSEIKILPLHGDLPQQEQEKALKEAKIIVSSPISWVSITPEKVTTIVDSWKERIAYIDEYWVPTLEVVDISKAESDQRKWRAWRVKEGEYYWVNNKKIEDLEKFSKTEIEKWDFARAFLILLAGNKKIENLDFLHKPNPKHIELIKEHLQKIDAIDENWEITEIWKKLTLIPTEPYLARMLYEAEKRNCLWNIIVMWSIIEAKDFLSSQNKTWKKVKFNTHKSSDLFYMYNWYKLLTSTKIENDYIKNQLINIWISKNTLINFNSNDKMLYEVINLWKLGIKEKYLLEIKINIERITKYYKEKNIEISFSNNPEDILLSLLSGFTNNIFECNANNTLYHHKKWKFKPTETSKLKFNKNKEDVFFWPCIKIIDEYGKAKKIALKLSKISKYKLVTYLAQNNKIAFQLQTKLIKNLKSEKRRLKVLVPITNELNMKNTYFHEKDPNFKNYFIRIFMPDFLIEENIFIRNFIEEMNNLAPKWKKFNTKLFKKELSNILEEFYEKIKHKNEKQVKDYLKNNKEIYEKAMEDERLIPFFLSPFI